MQKKQRAQRRTLTYSQMYGMGDAAGMMEGGNIFKKIGDFLKKSKIISTIGKVISPVIGVLPFPGAAVAGTALV